MAKLSDLFGRGVVASRPSAGIVGRYYTATDTSPVTTYRDNGSSWDTIATVSGTASPTTTRGDLIRRGASADERVALGAAGKLLTSDGTDAVWGQGPLTTTGDLLIGATGGTPTRLGAGTSGYVLTSGGAGVAPAWAAAAGGGAASLAWIDNAAIAGIGVNFDQASGLPTGVTRRNLTATEETYQQLDGKVMVAALTAANASEGYKLAIPGGSAWEVFAAWSHMGGAAASASDMLGFAVLDTNGTGHGIVHYGSDQTVYFVTITTYAYVSFQGVIGSTLRMLDLGALARMGVKKLSATAYTYWYSPDGIGRVEYPTTGDSTTYTDFMVGRFLGTSATARMGIRRINQLS